MKSELIPRGEKEAGCEPPLERRAKEDWDGNLEGRLKPELPTGKSQSHHQVKAGQESSHTEQGILSLQAVGQRGHAGLVWEGGSAPPEHLEPFLPRCLCISDHLW